MQGIVSNNRKYRVLVAVTGSVASIKAVELIKLLLARCEVKLVLTQSSKKFVKKEEIEELGLLYNVECLVDEDEQLRWTKRGDPVLHIELRKWADALIIAPLSANTLAKIANGLCDNLVTLVCRCWDMKLREKGEDEGHRKLIRPIITAPAMNTMMWEHPITEEQLQKLRGWGYHIVDPVQKTLICGDQGKGAMAQLQKITSALFTQLAKSPPA